MLVTEWGRSWCPCWQRAVHRRGWAAACLALPRLQWSNYMSGHRWRYRQIGLFSDMLRAATNQLVNKVLGRTVDSDFQPASHTQVNRSCQSSVTSVCLLLCYVAGIKFFSASLVLFANLHVNVSVLPAVRAWSFCSCCVLCTRPCVCLQVNLLVSSTFAVKRERCSLWLMMLRRRAGAAGP